VVNAKLWELHRWMMRLSTAFVVMAFACIHSYLVLKRHWGTYYIPQRKDSVFQ
jgi:hypothetical protein